MGDGLGRYAGLESLGRRCAVHSGDLLGTFAGWILAFVRFTWHASQELVPFCKTTGPASFGLSRSSGRRGRTRLARCKACSCLAFNVLNAQRPPGCRSGVGYFADLARGLGYNDSKIPAAIGLRQSVVAVGRFPVLEVQPISFMRFHLLLSFSLAILICFGAAGSLVAQQQSDKGSTLGIVQEKPESGPFVEIKGRYMVPYRTKIPGTDVVFDMVPIPGGTFTMGSPDDEDGRRDDEGPQFNVKVEPFWMGKYEVTWGEYKRFMAMERIFKVLDRKKVRKTLDKFQIDAVTAPSPLYDESFTYEAGEEFDQPAATITQYAAKQYTKWLSLSSGEFYRLPYEAEWEYACRAGTKTAFYFGDDDGDLEEHAWLIDNSDEERHYIGDLKPNPWGLYDMYGNVAEWVLDGYDENGYTHIKAGSTVTVEESFFKPKGLYPRVVRGGSFELEVEDCRSAARVGSDPDWKYEDPNDPKSPWWFTDQPATGVGFRLLRPLKTPATEAAKNEFWKADLEQIEDDAMGRIESNGKGALGVVDRTLPKEIEALPESDK